MAEDVKIILTAEDNASGALRKVGGEVENLGGGLANFASKARDVGKVLVTLGGAAAGFGIASLKAFSDVGDEIEKMSRRTGLSTESISVLRFAADQTGTSIESMGIALKGMALTMDQMDKNGKQADVTLRGLGIKFEDLKKMTPEQQFFTLGKAINAIEDPTQRTARAMDIFGKSGADLIPFFQEAGGNLDTFREKASQLGLVMDTETAAKAAKLNDTLGELKGQFTGVQFQLAQVLLPAVEKMNTVWLPAAIVAWRNFGDNVREIVAGVVASWNNMIATVSKPVNIVTSSFRNLPANLGFGGGRAAGGPVSPGTAYMVGERGPETFIPFMPGMIAPAGAGGSTVNMYFQSPMFLDRSAADKFASEVMDRLKIGLKL